MKRTWLPIAVLALVLSPVSAFAIDYVTQRGVEKPIGGAIKTVSRTEVVVFQTVGSKEHKIPSNEVVAVEWGGEPGEFGLGRDDESNGNLVKALERFTAAADAAKGASANIKADIDFFIARTAAKMAIADPAQADVAFTKLKAFVTVQRDNFRFFEAQALLAEVALRTNQTPVADTAFNSLTTAPWSDTKMAGQIGLARVLLAGKNVAGAKTGFDAVVALPATTPAETARHLQAMLGQARCMQMQMQHPEALVVLEQVVEKADAEETRTLAEAYLLQGDSLLALAKDDKDDKKKDAVLAYLHVDVIPSLAAESDLHAEALFRLAKLWGPIGQPARGEEASGKLQQLYPKSEWIKQLAGGTGG